MLAYKFLDAQGRGPFTGAPWTPGAWVEADTVAACRSGIHACRLGDLSYWLAASLWELELEGDLVESRHKVAGSRGRLIRRIDEYDAAVRELAAVGTWRSRDRAVKALVSAGNRGLAGRMAAATTPEDLTVFGPEADESTFAGTAAGLAADAAHFALHGNPAQSPFVAACSAGHAAAGLDGDQTGYDRGYTEERSFQSRWLAERLGLARPT